MVLLFFCALGSSAQQVKRLVIVKVDGLPSYYVDEVVRQRDRETGKSVLPWIKEVFYDNGTRLTNFYVRGMSLSAPSWSILDTGQHLQLKGNVEFDRFTLHPYDYLNLVPFYYGFALKKAIDTAGVEVLDTLKIPMLSDAFPLENKYTSFQLYQRGFSWGIFGGGFMNMIPRDPNDIADEWTMGFDTRSITVNQNERDVAEKIVKYPNMDYFDYYFINFDHISHHNNDDASRISSLRDLDRAIGHIWAGIRKSSRADETAIVLVSDHGLNTTPKLYSQGFNLVKLLASPEGGGHHVITKRFLLMNYSLKSINPFASMIRTSSHDSYYLDGQADTYPTALVDFDGNERSSIHLRNSDLNILHMLLLELKKGIKDPLRTAVANTALATIEKHRSEWQETLSSTTEEVNALDRWVAATRPKLVGLPLTEGPGVSKQQSRDNLRLKIAVASAESDIAEYRKYLASLAKLLAVTRGDLVSGKFAIQDLIAPNAMGDANTINELQNYAVGIAPMGLRVGADGTMDPDGSFKRVDYLQFLVDQRVRNNVQPGISNRPIDFVSVRVPLGSVKASLSEELAPDDDPILMYAGPKDQVLLLTRNSEAGEQSYRYLPIRNFRQQADGRATFEMAPIRDGLPLHYFEDAALNVEGDKKAFFDAWHTEVEWLRAVHKCMYSNGIIGLNEQMDRHPLGDDSTAGDAGLIRRFRERQRRLTEADILVEASNHWNFDVRGFNPGGNHGSFFRVSTNSTFMIAGGSATGISRGSTIDEPYDSLSLVPTLFRLMGKTDDRGNPTPDLAAKGYRQFPGRIVKELIR